MSLYLWVSCAHYDIISNEYDRRHWLSIKLKSQSISWLLLQIYFVARHPVQLDDSYARTLLPHIKAMYADVMDDPEALVNCE